MINPNWLKTFCTLVDIGHFTQTAELLYMTQSGVSQHIKKLEQQLDTPLLVRDGKSFSLTEAGMKLHQQGTLLLNQFSELEDIVKEDEPYSGTVKVASPGSLGLKLYPQLLDVQQKHEDLAIDYSFAPNSDIEEKIVEQKIDVGLITELSQARNVVCTKIAHEPLVLVTSHKVERVNWETLKSLGFIDHPDAQHHANLVLTKNFLEFEHIEQFEHRGFSNQISLILEPISRGIGFTVLPLNAVKAFNKVSQLKVHQLAHQAGESIYLCHNRQAYQAKRTSYIKSVICELLGNEWC